MTMMRKSSQRTVTPETLTQLHAANWQQIYPALVLYARYKARSLSWRSGNLQDLARGLNPEDLVNEAIRRVYEGDHAWDPSKAPDLLEFLKSSVLTSMFDELTSSANNRLVQRFPKQRDVNNSAEEEMRSPEGAPGNHRPNPEEQLLAKESHQQAEAVIKELKSAAVGDPKLQMVLESILEGVTAPRHIAQCHGLSIEKVYAAQKRLRRLLSDFNKETQGVSILGTHRSERSDEAESSPSTGAPSVFAIPLWGQ